MTVGSDMIIFGGNILSETLNFGAGGERMKNSFRRAINLVDNYTVDPLEQYLTKLHISKYQNYNDINEAYNDFIKKIMCIIYKVLPIKERQVINVCQEWFDGETGDEIKDHNKLCKS